MRVEAMLAGKPVLLFWPPIAGYLYSLAGPVSPVVPITVRGLRSELEEAQAELDVLGASKYAITEVQVKRRFKVNSRCRNKAN